MELTVATIGRARGLRGEVALDVRTDAPERRFAQGAVLQTRPDRGPLTVLRTQAASGTWFVTFDGIEDRTAAESIRGLELVVVEDSSDEEDAWYPHELTGLRVERTDGTVVGEVIGLQHMPAQDTLLVREVEGARTLIPFVRAIVPVVDVPGGRIVIDPPLGLLAADGDIDDSDDEVDGDSAPHED